MVFIKSEIMKLYTYGAHIKSRIDDNESHKHLCYQICSSPNKISIVIEEEKLDLQPFQRVLINIDIKHRLQNGEWENILVDAESKLGNELAEKLKKEKYLLGFEFDSTKIEELLNHKESGLRPEIKKAIDTIKKHHHNCELDEISNSVGISPEHFRRVFKDQVGITFKNYIKWQKIKRAISIKSKDQNIGLTDLAYESGFSDQAHMSKVFKQTFGHTPKEISKKL